MTNLNKDSSLRWSKDGGPQTPMAFDPSSGVGTLSIPQVTTVTNPSDTCRVIMGWQSHGAGLRTEVNMKYKVCREI